MRLTAIVAASALLLAAPVARAAEPGTSVRLSPEKPAEPANGGPEGAATPPGQPQQVPAEALRVLADTQVAYGWSGAFKTLGVLGMTSSVAAAAWMASQKTERDREEVSTYDAKDIFRATLPGVLGSGVLVIIGALIDESAAKDLRAVGILPPKVRGSSTFSVPSARDRAYGSTAESDRIGP